jgi:3-oxoacyl-[acyl-carrier protein] reductase
MQPGLSETTSTKTALVLGGTGYVGSAVLRELARRGVPATFTYCTSDDKAKVLAAEYGHTAVKIDLADAAAVRRLEPADVVIHCAAISSTDWQRSFAINVESAHVVATTIAERGTPADLVFLGGLDRVQSLPLPPVYAATQGALSALVMALAHELGPRGIRVNMLALGVLAGGISSSLAARRRKDYETFSALRRAGTADEAAKAIAWLALENTYIQGKVIPVNGGI